MGLTFGHATRMATLREWSRYAIAYLKETRLIKDSAIIKPSTW
ncbi:MULTISPECIES: hypothetical protein [Moorena]|nr:MULTISPECIES: hypothetical protein [Moorena]